MMVKAGRKFVFFDRCTLFVNCVFALLLILSYGAPFINPSSWCFIAFLGLGYPFLLIINIAFLIYWLIRFARFSLISAISILLGLKIMISSFGFHLNTNDKNRSPSAIRIMAYNVHGFGGIGKLNGKYIQNDVIKLINTQHPDIINFEEFYTNVLTRQSIIPPLNKAVNSNYYYSKAYDYTQWDSAGIAIFSRFPIINRGVIQPDANSGQIQAIYADIKKGAVVFRVYCVHLQSTHLDDNDHQYLENTSQGKLSVHGFKDIYRKLRQAFIQRSFQVSLLKKDMSSCPYPYIIAGDFNDTPNSYAVTQINKGLKNAFIENGAGFGLTYYGDFPGFQIDYILTSPQFTIQNYRIIKQKLSDHYPVVSDLSIK